MDSLIINGIFNLLLLTPLIYLVSKMQERHDVLTNTIGYLPQEEEALKTGYYLLIGSLSMVIVGTILEVLFFWLYNGSCHPFANILKVSSNNFKFKTKRIAKDWNSRSRLCWTKPTNLPIWKPHGHVIKIFNYWQNH